MARNRLSPPLTPSGLVIFSFKRAGVTVTEAGVPAILAGTAFRLYAEASGDFGREQIGSIQTGIAIANSSASPIPVTFELTTLSGASAGRTATTTVPADGHVAMFLSQIEGFGSLQLPFQGILRVSAASPAISVIGLRGRYNERGHFLITTTTPSIENTPSSNSDLFFPHLADGGGYTTQFILFSGSAAQSSSGILRFLSQSGQILNLGLR